MTDIGFTWQHYAPLDPSASLDSILGMESWSRLLGLWSHGATNWRADIQRMADGTFLVHITENSKTMSRVPGFVSLEAAKFFVDCNFTADGPDQPLQYTLKEMR